MILPSDRLNPLKAFQTNHIMLAENLHLQHLICWQQILANIALGHWKHNHYSTIFLNVKP
jgi:hypothetical protein